MQVDGMIDELGYRHAPEKVVWKEADGQIVKKGCKRLRKLELNTPFIEADDIDLLP